MRYRAALKLKAEQARYWPAVANALRALAREPQMRVERDHLEAHGASLASASQHHHRGRADIN